MHGTQVGSEKAPLLVYYSCTWCILWHYLTTNLVEGNQSAWHSNGHVQKKALTFLLKPAVFIGRSAVAMCFVGTYSVMYYVWTVPVSVSTRSVAVESLNNAALVRALWCLTLVMFAENRIANQSPENY